MPEEQVQETPEQKQQRLAAALLEAPAYYSYDEHFIYVGRSHADHDPAEFDINNQIQWMLPAKATWVEVPTITDDEVAVFDPETETWSKVLKELVTEDEPPPLALHEQIAQALLNIDGEVDAIIFAVIGHRGQEYLDAEADAAAFKAGESPGEYIAADMAAFGNTAEQAADSILLQASIWRQAQATMRTLRLQHKQQARNAASSQDLAVVLSNWHEAIDAVRHSLEV